MSVWFKVLKRDSEKEIMETLEADNSANESRTKHSITIGYKCLSTVLIIAIAILVPLNAAESIDFDNVDRLWFNEAVIYPIPVNQTGFNNTVPLLKIHGLKAIDADDEIRVKPTFSTSDCMNTEADLQIVNSIFEPSSTAATANEKHSSSDLFVALNNFDFGPNVNAYLCIKSRYENDFQHMGANSKFST